MESESVRGGRVFHINKKCSCVLQVDNSAYKIKFQIRSPKIKPQTVNQSGAQRQSVGFGWQIQIVSPKVRV